MFLFRIDRSGRGFWISLIVLGGVLVVVSLQKEDSSEQLLTRPFNNEEEFGSDLKLQPKMESLENKSSSVWQVNDFLLVRPKVGIAAAGASSDTSYFRITQLWNSHHLGVDIDLARYEDGSRIVAEDATGQPLYAPSLQSPIVAVQCWWEPLGGFNITVIEPSLGSSTPEQMLYSIDFAHTNGEVSECKEGLYLAGAKIGEIGNSGAATTGPHLHFQVRTISSQQADLETVVCKLSRGDSYSIIGQHIRDYPQDLLLRSLGDDWIAWPVLDETTKEELLASPRVVIGDLDMTLRIDPEYVQQYGEAGRLILGEINRVNDQSQEVLTC